MTKAELIKALEHERLIAVCYQEHCNTSTLGVIFSEARRATHQRIQLLEQACAKRGWKNS
jgi:hypothetical protein